MHPSFGQVACNSVKVPFRLLVKKQRNTVFKRSFSTIKKETIPITRNELNKLNLKTIFLQYEADKIPYEDAEFIIQNLSRNLDTRGIYYAIGNLPVLYVYLEFSCTDEKAKELSLVDLSVTSVEGKQYVPVVNPPFTSRKKAIRFMRSRPRPYRSFVSFDYEIEEEPTDSIPLGRP